MTAFFDFFAQPPSTPISEHARDDHDRAPKLFEQTGHVLTVADVLEHGPVVVTIIDMDAKGASAIVTGAADANLVGSTFRFDAKTPCIKRAPIQVLAKMRQNARVTLACIPGRSGAPVLTITDVL